MGIRNSVTYKRKMQFSEISELQSAIECIRLSTQNSPRFHDRHDTEVDRLFYSSPETVVDWSALPPPITKVSEATISPPVRGVPSNVPNENATHDNEETAARGGAVKGGCKVIVFDTKIDNSSGNTQLFTREEVERVKETPAYTSALSQLMQGPEGDTGMQLPAHGVDSVLLSLTIYLPNQVKMVIELYEVSTVEESIETILRTHRAEGRKPELLYGHLDCYEMRLHDQDGLPDEDFPALDRSRKIANFGDAGNHEYCLCERPDAAAKSSQRTPSMAETKSIPSSNRTPSSARSTFSTRRASSSQNFLKILLPTEGYAVVALDDNTTGDELMSTLRRKHRLQLATGDYVFRISAEDKDRLRLQSDLINFQTKLKQLGLNEIAMVEKMGRKHSSTSLLGGVHRSRSTDSIARPKTETFVYNDVTVAMYKEWQVIRKTKYGKKQSRMLGVDLHTIYENKNSDTSSRGKAMSSERAIATVATVHALENPTSFCIVYGPPDNAVVEYSAATAYDCAEIVSKIRYIMQRGLAKDRS